MTGNKIQFVLGGARSGKSQFAETLALDLFHAANKSSNASTAKLVYIATAEAFDEEMRARIDLHKGRREFRPCRFDFWQHKFVFLGTCRSRTATQA